MYHPSSNVFMTNKTPSDAEKHHESAEPENSKTARMFFFILFFLSFFLPFFLPFFLSSFPFFLFSFFPFFLFSVFPSFLLSFFPSFLLSFFRQASSILRELLTVVYTWSSTILYRAVHNPIAFSQLQSCKALVTTHSKTMASSLGCHFAYLYMCMCT